jgi:hypothetical protein
MQPSSSSLLRAIVMVGAIAGVPGTGSAVDGDATAVTVAMSGGDTATGRLEAIDSTGVRLATESGPQAIELDAVRRVDCQRGGPAAVAGVSVVGTDGARLTGTDVTWEGDTVRLETSEGVVTLPVARVRTIDWLRAERQGGNDVEPAWRQSLPDELESDVVVVAKGEETQCVPCAIVGITADAVRVVLDGETIPVKRDRVVGLQWLREPAAAGGIVVEVTGGVLPASQVERSPEGLVVDDVVRLPADCLRSVDYAAGRTTRLAGLATEQLDVEPFFGSLTEIDELIAAFRPRVVAGDDGSPRKDLLIRPRTVAVWRVPPGSRTFTTAISRGAAVGGGALVVIAVDGREVFRGSVDDASAAGAAGISIGEVPLDGARRLSITVDYGRAGPVGGIVILRDPLFTK